MFVVGIVKIRTLNKDVLDSEWTLTSRALRLVQLWKSHWRCLCVCSQREAVWPQKMLQAATQLQEIPQTKRCCTVMSSLDYQQTADDAISENTTPPLCVWPHLFRAAGHEKRRAEQSKWTEAFRLYNVHSKFSMCTATRTSSYSAVGTSVFMYLA